MKMEVYLCMDQQELFMVATTRDVARAWLRSHIPPVEAWSITSRLFDPNSGRSGDLLSITTTSVGPPQEPYTVWEAKCFGRTRRSFRDEDAARDWLADLTDPQTNVTEFDDCYIQKVTLDTYIE